MKICPKCKKEPRHKKLAYCYECQKAYVREYNKTDSGKQKIRKYVKDLQRKRNGFTPELFDQLFESQGNCCAICKAKKPSKNSKRDWHGDHDHKTGKARGVLCAGCNTLLGRIESVGFDWVEKAKKYLDT